jgi:hypothetical protein
LDVYGEEVNIGLIYQHSSICIWQKKIGCAFQLVSGQEPYHNPVLFRICPHTCMVC